MPTKLTTTSENMGAQNLLITICFLVIAAQCLGSDVQTTPASLTLQASFQSLGQDFGTQQPWKNGDPSAAQQHSLDQLEKLAAELMQQPDYAVAMLNLLNQYRDQDGYPRQKLFRAIFDRKYQKGDLPFLKNVLLTTSTYRYEKDMGRIGLYWVTEDGIKNHLLFIIIGVIGNHSLVDDPDKKLFYTNPTAWFEKYAH